MALGLGALVFVEAEPCLGFQDAVPFKAAPTLEPVYSGEEEPVYESTEGPGHYPAGRPWGHAEQWGMGRALQGAQGCGLWVQRWHQWQLPTPISKVTCPLCECVAGYRLGVYVCPRACMCMKVCVGCWGGAQGPPTCRFSALLPPDPD